MPKVDSKQGTLAVESITFKIEQNGSVVAILPAPLRTFSHQVRFARYQSTVSRMPSRKRAPDPHSWFLFPCCEKHAVGVELMRPQGQS